MLQFLKASSTWYVIAAITDVMAVAFYPEFRIFTKPLLIIVLAITFFNWTKGVTNSRKYQFLMALFFAWLGDVFLLSDSMFLYGLGAFLIMQLLYSRLFFLDQNFYGWREWSYGIGLLLLIAIVLFFIGPSLGHLAIAVGLYSASIAIMSFSSFTRDYRYAGYRMIFYGTILFIVSDSVLAINQFAEPLPLGGIIVMSTYLTAQYLISFGYASFLKDDLSD